MNEIKLACCVVRDLLPSYIEGLTEPETTALVKEHLEGCPDCRKTEQDMRTAIPLEKPAKHELNFLKRVRRTRLIAAALSCILALWCIWWLYDREFHYPNTEAGRLAAVEDYIPSPDNSAMSRGVRAGTPLHAAAWETIENHLFIFYFADNSENVHGVIHLVRGLNGKYRILEAELSPSEYSGGLYGENLTPTGTDWELFYLAGYNCRDIYRTEVEFMGVDSSGETAQSFVRSFDLTGDDFLKLMDWDTLNMELSVPDSVIRIYVKDMRLFDKDGQDITSQYAVDPPTASWNSGKTTAETFLLYVYIGIAALLGIVFIRYFLRRD